MIKLIVGLGNPGREYADTRHNVGFEFLNELVPGGDSDFKLQNQLHARCLRLQDPSCLLAKPTTFMNLSGRSVSALMRYYKLTQEQLLVVHDDIDLSPGVVKLKCGGGHGGHNGLRDIMRVDGLKQFWRLRIGVGHPGHKSQVSSYVLRAAPESERIEIDVSVTRALRVLPDIIHGNFEAAMLSLHS